MRLVLLAHAPALGGSTEFLVQVRDYLLARNHTVQVVFGYKCEPADPRFPGALYLQGTFASWRERMRAYAALIESCRPDVVYTFSGLDEFDVFRFLHCARVRHVFSVESQPFMDIPFCLHTYQGFCEALTANTPDAVEEINRHTSVPGLLVPYRMPQLESRLAASAEITEVPAGKPIEVAYVSRLDWLQKRAHWLPSIVRRCTQAGADIVWHIYGDGPEAPLVRRKLAGLPNVNFHGWTKHDVLYTRLPQHQIFFLCSRWEGLPVSMLEAMRFGLASVVPDIPAGIRWTLGHGGGWSYGASSPQAAADALVEACRDRALLARKQNEAREVAARLFPAQQVDEYFAKMEAALQKLTFNGHVLDPATAPPFRSVRWTAFFGRVPFAWHKFRESPDLFLKKAARPVRSFQELKSALRRFEAAGLLSICTAQMKLLSKTDSVVATAREDMEPRKAPNGRCYLNVGCGSHFSPEWNNLDLHGPPGVITHDLRKPLPFADASFDVVYSSHVLEHFVPGDGEQFLREQKRVLKPGGICRVVVPDLEGICRDYLAQLEKAALDPTPEAVLDYQWTVLQLVDQMVREDCGGEMLKALREGRYNPEFVRQQVGDEAALFLDAPAPAPGTSTSSPLQPLKQRVKRILGRDARGQGEAHRWMYDRVSLRLLLERLGFSTVRVVTHLESSVPDWDKYQLDTAQSGSGPRKPDSLFVEGVKSA